MASDNTTNAPAASKPARHNRSWLLIIPFVAMLVPPLFNYREPSIAGVPFYYWYQLLWIPMTAFLTWIAYRR
jgi:hypothetical protein